MTDDDRMDTGLRAYAERWRGASVPAPAVDLERLVPRRSGHRTWRLVAASAAAVAVVIAGGTQLVGDDGRSPAPPRPARTGEPTSVVPWSPLPATHPQIPTTTTAPSPDPAEAAGKPECRASDLHATAERGAAAGTYYLTVRLALAGDHPCRLEGYPAVELLDQGRPAAIPVKHQVDDSSYRGAVLVADKQPALLRFSWSADWCAAPVHNDTLHLVLPGGFVTLPGLGGSNCYGTPGSGHKEPVEVGTFQPVKTREAQASTAYADVEVTGALDITATTAADLDFVVTLTSPHDLVLDPCPDYQIIQSGHAEPVAESYALNCAAVPYQDDQGRRYLPAGRPVQFAMHTTSGDPGVYKLTWVLDTVDQRSVGGTLTVTTPAAPSASADPTESAQQKGALREGVRTIQAFLNTWRRDGMLVAARRYFDPASQPPSAVGLPRLSSGKVLGAKVSSWDSPDHFTLEVALELHFVGDPLAWDEGDNGRFITVTRDGGGFRLDFATSP